MTRQRNAASTHSSPQSQAETGAEPAGPLEAAEETAAPDLSDARQLSRLINTMVNRSLRELLGTLVSQTDTDARACVATKGTVQHTAGPDTVYILDYDVHIHYKCVTPTSSTEGKSD